MERASLFDGITEFPCGDSVFLCLEVKKAKQETLEQKTPHCPALSRR